MKLASQYNRINAIVSLGILLITSVTYYLALGYILRGRVDKDLKVEEQEVLDYVKENHKLPLPTINSDLQIRFLKLEGETNFIPEFRDTLFFDPEEKKMIRSRSLTSAVSLDGQRYKITIIESKVETEDLIQLIFLITLAISVLLLICMNLINRLVLKEIWRPFYATLQTMKAFNIADKDELRTERTSINEFEELNQAVSLMSAHVKKDYRDLKNFTENASHEMLTPISLINSNLDTLLQTGPFTELQGKILEDMYGSVSRMARVNQSLLLLVKIENQLIRDQETINIKDLVIQKISQFHEMTQGKQIEVSQYLMDKEMVMSRYLADVLFNNLISNAIRHNYQGGEMVLTLTRGHFTISNTGAKRVLHKEDIFKRFNKGAESEGTGLGLAITRQICDNYNIRLSYDYNHPYHSFILKF